MKKEIDVINWNRKEHFEFFTTFDEPFFGITAAINVEIAYEKAKDFKIPFFLYYLHKVLITVNAIENFRYRIEDKKLFEHSQIDASATIMREDKTFGFSYIPFNESLEEFTKIALTEIERIQTTPGLFTREYPENIIHFSALPWINFTGITHSRSFTFPDSCPKISVGKMYEENQLKKMSVSVTVHHALMDGYHVGLFFEKLQEEMNK